MAATASSGLWWRSPCANADVNKDVTTGRLIDLEKGAARAEDRIGKQDQRILELEQTLARVALGLLIPPLIANARQG
ncbi:hypothetical protein G3M48_002971 [Beauveria asiatica]|uniref:Uncharacterized protein n=1 Tax=Beauveria asiatica TaxID=1069075 RepID=A0AAW0RWZ5_9HYPO